MGLTSRELAAAAVAPSFRLPAPRAPAASERAIRGLNRPRWRTLVRCGYRRGGRRWRRPAVSGVGDGPRSTRCRYGRGGRRRTRNRRERKKKRGDCRRVPLGTRSFLHAVPTLIGPRLGRTANWAEALPLRLFFLIQVVSSSSVGGNCPPAQCLHGGAMAGAHRTSPKRRIRARNSTGRAREDVEAHHELTRACSGRRGLGRGVQLDRRLRSSCEEPAAMSNK